MGTLTDVTDVTDVVLGGSQTECLCRLMYHVTDGGVFLDLLTYLMCQDVT